MTRPNLPPRVPAVIGFLILFRSSSDSSFHLHISSNMRVKYLNEKQSVRYVTVKVKNPVNVQKSSDKVGYKGVLFMGGLGAQLPRND